MIMQELTVCCPVPSVEVETRRVDAQHGYYSFRCSGNNNPNSSNAKSCKFEDPRILNTI